MRSLAIDHTFDPKIYETGYQNQYMFGKAFMIAPFESTKEFGKIYLPEGSWYNLYTDEKYDGKQEVIQPLNISRLPVYVKESSIVPMQSLVQSTAQAPTDTLTLHIYNGSKPNEFVYYEDDGKSYSYEHNDFCKRSIIFNPSARQIVLGEVAGSFKSKFHYVKLIMHAFKSIRQIKVNGNPINGMSKFYNMIPPFNNVDPQGNTGGNKEAAAVYETDFSLNNKKQTIDFELN
jgi:alpha-glucosidase